jgi:predicted Rossmann-fold nucleotide-binding protein
MVVVVTPARDVEAIAELTKGLAKARVFEPFRNALYTPDELYDHFDPARPSSYLDCTDWRTFISYVVVGNDHRPVRPQQYVPVDLDEHLARRLHDHFIVNELNDFLATCTPPTKQGVVAMMGGHDVPRGPGLYLTVARLARDLTRDGFLMATGGGPGLMEATNLGAWLATASDERLVAAVDQLATAPLASDEQWLSVAWRVRAETAPTDRAACTSLGVPTWFYGHEPPNVFASHIAKYFENSLREEGLLAIATHGVIFAPGNAGTVQEIFQDGCQNYYATYGYASPMVLFDVDYWNPGEPPEKGSKPVWPLLSALAKEKGIENLLTLTSSAEEARRRILNFRPPSG